MAISASAYKKILSIKKWATNKLPTVTENSYTELLTDLLKYLDDLITNNDFFETDIQTIIAELNKLLNMTFPSQEDINNAINTAKTEITKEYTTAIENAKTKIKTEYTTAIKNSGQILDSKIDAVQKNLNSVNSALQTNINTVSTKIDTTMNEHKKNIKDTVTGAMTNLVEGE